MLKVTIGLSQQVGYCDRLKVKEDPMHGKCFIMLAKNIGSVGLARINELRSVEQVNKIGE